MKSVHWPKPGYASITCSTISNIPYNLSLADEHVGDVTIPTQVIEYNPNFSRQISQSDWNIQIKINYFHI